jgi:endopeptidase Clp ATP-binding regulatory subunit ClpX
MKERDEKIPDIKEIEKEISELLAKKFGSHVKLISPMILPQEAVTGTTKEHLREKKSINFNLKPEELIAYLDQYVVKQDQAKAILATKICTHFNRIRRAQEEQGGFDEMAGGIKNNVLMIGPTGVGKTYIIKLIAAKLGVPFVKGDATKFSETGYVGGDVEDLVRDLVREADDDIELAQYGIIYIDEIDKIASAKNLIGADVSRTGVQRALLKPMEETEVDLKVPHDPISVMQEIERFRKTGKREKVAVNTKNVLFIMSGAFSDLVPIIQRRLTRQGIGFGARIASAREEVDILKHVKAEDLIEYGFESEFVGRLPVKAVFDHLGQEDLYQILKTPTTRSSSARSSISPPTASRLSSRMRFCVVWPSWPLQRTPVPAGWSASSKRPCWILNASCPPPPSESFRSRWRSWPTPRSCCNACWRRPRTRTGAALSNG